MAKIAIISDLHGNLEALKAVVTRLKEEKPDEWLCLGDLVGYGPFSNECIELVKEMDMKCVKGNHDAGVTGELSINHFRNPNRKLIEITKKVLSQESINWLKSLPLVVAGDNWIAAHSHPLEPNSWKYVDSAFIAREILGNCDKDFCLIGHTHKPAIVSDRLGINSIHKGSKYLINPGSVGQSRDGDFRASCAVLNITTFEYKNIRVEFDIEPALSGLMKLGFSRKEADHMMRV